MTPSVQPAPAKILRSYGLAIAAVIAVYAIAFGFLMPYVPGTLGSVDATAKIWQAHSVGALDSAAGWTDLRSRFIPDWYVTHIDGAPYTVYLNPFVYLLAFVWRLIGPTAWNALPLVAGLATVLLIARLARRHKLVGEGDLWKLVLVVALATPIIYYAFIPVEHSLAAAFASAAFLLVADAAADAWLCAHPVRWVRLVVAGVFLALAALTRGECYLLALAMGFVVIPVFCLGGLKRTLCALGALVAGGVATLAAWFALVPHAWTLQIALVVQGGKTPVGMAHRFWHLLAGLHPGERVAGYLGEPASAAVGIVGGACLLAAVVLAVFAGTRRTWVRHLAIAMLAAGLAAVLASWRIEGIFATCPFIVLVAFLVRRSEGMENPVATLVLGTCGFYVALCGLLLPNAGASQFGPRFLLPVIPALACVAFAAVRWRTLVEPARWLAWCLAATLVVSLATEAKGVLMLRRGGEIATQTESILKEMPTPYVVFSPAVSMEYYIYRAPTIFVAGGEILQAKDEKQLDEIIAALRSRGDTHFTMLTMRERASERLDMLMRAGASLVGMKALPRDGQAFIVTIGKEK